MAGLYAPLPTLRRRPRGRLRTDRGRRGLLLPHRSGLSPHTPCQSPGALTIVPITDRTVWRLSKDVALQSYSSRSFYLPVPEAKEIIFRRGWFLKTKGKAPATTTKREFF